MKLDYHLKLEQSQKLVMTPELKLAITLLQYSALELQEHIQEELLNNPVLEMQELKEEKELGEEEELPGGDERSGEEDFPWEEYFRDMDIETAGSPSFSSRNVPEYQPTVENCAETGGTMLEDLLAQLRLLRLPARQYGLAAFLAGNLDSNGYLQGEIDELAAALGANPADLAEGLSLVQKLEPAGVGCRNLQECLLLQLKRVEKPPPLALAIVNHYLPAAADGRLRYIAMNLKCSEEAAREAVAYIRTLNPKPGSIYGEGEETRYIVPDVIVEKVDGQYMVLTNESRIPQLMVSPFYQQILKNGPKDEQLATFIKTKLDRACWLIRSIEQRRLTLFRVTQQVVDIQRPFLDEGIKKLKPLTLKEVALNLGLHESTISRAAANKYVQTPRGLFPLKFFFSSGVSGSNGDDYSAHSIKSYIEELVAAENQNKPLSDQLLAECLQERGINISRRTVAKYREEMEIPASFKRRQS